MGRMDSFEEFWPYYLGEHRTPGCRALHYFGTSAGLLVTIVAAAWNRPWLVPIGLLIGYGAAWIGHFFIEHNKPATFGHPLWSLRADLKMLGLFVRGEVGAELTRLYGSPAPARDAPLRVAK